MEDAIINFAKQFEWEPEMVNGDNMPGFKNVVVAGMGGSHLATGIIKMYKPGIDLYVHRGYGLPPYEDEFLKNSLLVASSYSGNTEEIVDFLETGLKKGYNMAVMTTGGKLMEIAKENNLPSITIPATGIQPRSALGYQAKALAAFLKEDILLGELSDLSKVLDPESLREQGQKLAEQFSGKVPVIYSSLENLTVAYNWKIKFNETGKVPSFYNIFSELNHNEMSGFDFIDSTKHYADNFAFIFIRDQKDHPKIQRRMDITRDLYKEKGMDVVDLSFQGSTLLEQIFNSLILGDWTALHTALANRAEPEQVPMIEEFKKKLAK